MSNIEPPKRWRRHHGAVGAILTTVVLALPWHAFSRHTGTVQTTPPSHVAQHGPSSSASSSSPARPMSDPGAGRLLSGRSAGPEDESGDSALSVLGPWTGVLADDARRLGLPASLVWSVALTESHGDASATSSFGAVGLMQVTPVAARELHLSLDSTAQQAWAGVAYLAYVADLVGASPSCLAVGPGGTASCAWHTDRAISAYYTGPWAGYVAQSYVATVRRRWAKIKEHCAEGGE